MVPTATIRPPRARASFSARAVSAETEPHSACMRCSAVSSAFTGRKVPAPTCSVTKWRLTPRSSRRRKSSSVKCRPAVGRRDGALVPGVDGLVVGAGPCRRSAACRRCRAAAAIRRGGRSPRRGRRRRTRSAGPPRRPRPSPRPRHRAARARRPCSRQLSPKRMRSPTCELLGRAREGAPAVGALALVQHDLDPGGRILAHAKAVEPGRDHLGVVEHQHVARLQQDPAGRGRCDPRGRPRAGPRACARASRGSTGRSAMLFSGRFEIEQVDAHEGFWLSSRTP